MWNSVDVAGLGSNASGREVSCGCVCECVCVCWERKRRRGARWEVGHREGPLWVLNLQRHGQGTTKAVAGGDFSQRKGPHLRELATSHWTQHPDSGRAPPGGLVVNDTAPLPMNLPALPP